MTRKTPIHKPEIERGRNVPHEECECSLPDVVFLPYKEENNDAEEKHTKKPRCADAPEILPPLEQPVE
jgi:hypothetical protein